MKYIKALSLPAFVLSVLFGAATLAAFAADAPVDFFAARAFGGDRSSFYVVKAGDFDGDGRTDAAVSGLEDVLVYYGQGNGLFSPPTPLLRNPTGIPLFPVTADFNGDGRSDVAMRYLNALVVYLGNADRTFSPPISSGGDPLPVYLEAVDFDGDGKTDLVGGGSGAGGSAIAFYKGLGDGAFSFVEKIDTEYDVLPLISDFNNDSRPDVLYASGGAHRISLNTGGHFGAPVAIGVDPLVSVEGVGDFNGDGLKDLVSTDGTVNPWTTIWLGAANLAFVEGQDVQISSRERIFLKEIADLDNDLKPDLIYNSLNRTFVRKSLGNGTFAPPVFYGEGGNGDLFARDLNADGWLDLVAVQPTTFAVPGAGSFAVLLNTRNGNFKSAPTLPTGPGTKDFAIADLNGDQLKDFVVANRGSGSGGQVTIVIQLAIPPGAAEAAGNGPQYAAGKIVGPDSLGGIGIDPNAVAAGDFNNDGKTDVVAVGSSSGAQNVLLLRNEGNNTFALNFAQIGTGEIYDAAAADFNADGRLDLATLGGAGVSISFGNGNGTFAAPVSYLGAFNSTQIAIADLNNDAKPDLAVSTNNNKIGVLLNGGAGTFSNPANPPVAGDLSGIAAAEMNGDGIVDLIASKSGGVAVLNGLGNGTFGAESTYPITPGRAFGLAVADFNADGKADAATLAGTNAVSILLNNGAGALGRETLWSGGVTMAALAAGDLNNDQKSDLMTGYTTSSDGYTKLLFNLTEEAPAPAAAPFDFDGDGKTDVSVFRPSAGQWWYERSVDAQTAALRFGLSADRPVPADFTGDGKTDVAFFRPSTSEWFVLRSENGTFYSFPFGAAGDVPAVGDFDGDGKADAAVFRPSTGVWYLSKSSGGTSILQFGAAGDAPVVADYDGDGQTDVAVWRAAGANGAEWWYRRSSDGRTVALQFGAASDVPVPGDYTGDGQADVAFFRPADGQWFVLRSEDFSYYAFPFGAAGDRPAPGDYDGDGKFDAAVFRAASATWFVQRSTAGTAIRQFGADGDLPLPGVFAP
jgi:hypothetical protein